MSVSLSIACQGVNRDRLDEVIPARSGALDVVDLEWEKESTFSLELDVEGVREILPCFSCGAAAGYQFALEYRPVEGGEVRRARLAPIGGMSGEQKDGEGVEAAVDLLAVGQPLKEARLWLTVACEDAAKLREAPALLSVSLRREGEGAFLAEARQGKGVDMVVPAKSQRVLRKELAGRVCSPTCLSMLLEFYGRPNEVYGVIERVRHAPSDLYGVWPANVQAATGWGMLGYLRHFSAWEEARRLLEGGLPIIASIRFEEGELSGAPIRRSAGHLVLLRGYGEGVVRVNDPAAATEAGVAREYDLEEFLAIWMGRSAVGYVIFPEEKVR